METQKFLNYLNVLEGFKTVLKEQHWLAETLNNHQLVDNVLSSLNQFQDNFAEEGFIVFGTFAKNSFYSVKIANEDFEIILNKLTNLITNIREDSLDFPGILAICDEFIHTLNKYKYLNKMP